MKRTTYYIHRYVVLITLLLLGALLFLTACVSNETTEPQASQSDQASAATTTNTSAPTEETTGTEPVKEYIFTYQDQEIATGMPAGPIIAALGEPIHQFEAPSCAYQGMDIIYTYAGVEIQIYTDADQEYIYSIALIDDSVNTPEGVSLGMTSEQIIETYGDDYLSQENLIVYMTKDTKLSFSLRDDELIFIEYEQVIQ